MYKSLNEITFEDNELGEVPCNSTNGSLDIPNSKMDIIIENAVSVDYSLKSYAILFLTYSFIGWLWEIVLFLIFEQDIVNTGMLHGPWLPIYGVGGVAALELFKNIRYSPRKTFFSIMLVAGILEYTAHFATEQIFGVTWWDYSDYLLSINDRICIEGLIAFGVLGCVAIYIVSPRVNELIQNKHGKWQNYFLTVAGIIFAIDMIYSFISPNMQNIY